jgi:hypothetical protein
MPSSLSLITPTPFHLLPIALAFSAIINKHLTPLATTYLCRSVRPQGLRLVCPRSDPHGKVLCITSQQSQPPLHSSQSVLLCLLVPRWSSILADVVCTIRFTVVLACFIVEIVSTCAFCSLSLITPTPFHLFRTSPRFLRYNKQAPHSSRHHLLVQIRARLRSERHLLEYGLLHLLKSQGD